MSDLGVQLRPRGVVVAVLGTGAAVVAVAVVAMAVTAATSEEQRVGYGVGALVLGLVGVVGPLLMVRAVTRTRVRVSAEAVARTVGDRVTARLPFHRAEEIRVTWQVNPGVMGRKPVITLLGPAEGGARGVVVNGLLVADLEPLLDRVAVEVARRPAVLTSDRAVYDDVMAARPFG